MKSKLQLNEDSTISAQFIYQLCEFPRGSLVAAFPPPQQQQRGEKDELLLSARASSSPSQTHRRFGGGGRGSGKETPETRCTGR